MASINRHRCRVQIARIPLTAPSAIVDLGCGAGNVAQVLAARWPQARISGVDGSAAMLAAARAATLGAARFRWIEADLGAWTPDTAPDLVFSNAALHWLDDHGTLFPRLLAAVAAGGARPRVFYELDTYQGTIYGPADQTLYADMIRLAGGDPINTGSPTVFSIPLETLLAADPQVIVLGDAAYGMTAEIVAARPGWGGMTAVKDGAIRPVNDVVVTRPGPRLVEGLRALALAIDPAASLPPAPPPSPGG
jgi:SAM-dependent methyltransferase